MKISEKQQSMDTKPRIIFTLSKHVYGMAPLVASILAMGSFVYPAAAQESAGTSESGAGGGWSIDQRAGATDALGQATGSAGASTDTSIDVFSATLGHAISTDSNLFRRPDSANPSSETINATTASLRFNKPISQQNFQLEASQTLNSYSNFSYLDYTGTNYRGAWTWTPSRRWTVGLNASRSKSLAPFEDTLGGSSRNVSISESRGFTADGWLISNWYLVLGLSRADQKSEQGVVNRPDQRTNNASVGLRYVTALGNTITLTQRKTDGDYLGSSAVPSVTGNQFDETETSLATNWRLSDKSSLQGRVARRERNNNQVGQRDFSGPAIELGYSWLATSRLSLSLLASRNTSALQDPSFSYSEDDAISLSPTYRITDKLSARMRLARSESTYKGEGSVPPTGPGREDKTNNAEIGLDWALLRNLSVNTSLQHMRRNSNQALAEYDDDIARVGVTWQFW